MSGVNLLPYKKIVQSSATDGEGGWTKTDLGDSIVYLNIRVHENQTVAVCRQQTDLTVKDVIEIESAQYEVTEVLKFKQDGYKQLFVQRLDRPIEPVTENSGS